MPFRDYQEHALHSLLQLESPFKSLIMPTGSGKTRVALAFAQHRLEQGLAVVYIAESDALVKQVLDEATEIGLEARWIPGMTSTTAPQDVLENRAANIQDYDAGLLLGVFNYASYFLGSNVPRAHTAIIDDAHALVAERYSFSVVRVPRDNMPGPYRRVLSTIRETNPTLSPLLEVLEIPVHRGGPAILVPPPEVDEVSDTIRELVSAAAQGTGYARFHLQRCLEASDPHYISWPCVVTADSITWRPFVVPFESLGQVPGDPLPETEVVLLTATDGPEDFLRVRLGLPEPTTRVPLAENIPEMGSRLVLPYEDLKSGTPPSQAQANVIAECARKFGTLLVTVISDLGESQLRERLPEDIRILRFRDMATLEDYRSLPLPKILVLVNRPVGVDLPPDICRVAIHLDMPYSSLGHGVVSGDIERLGTVAEASLGVRLSQLLGRLNRGPDDRSVHFLFAGPLPLRRGTTFTQSLDPAVLLDLLIGQRGICRDFRLPREELYQELSSFLEGDDSVRETHRERQEGARARLLVPHAGSFTPDAGVVIESDLLLARGNFDAAFQKLRRLAQDAEQGGSNAHAAFYEYMQASIAHAMTIPENESFGPGGRRALLQRALQMNPGSPALLGALRQAMAGMEEGAEEFLDAHVRLSLQRRGLGFYEQWVSRNEGEVPSEDELESESAWEYFWRGRLSSADHDDLLEAWTDAFQLLGCNAEREYSRNDARITWQDIGRQRTLALEVKGRQHANGGESTELTVDDVIQAFDNARRIDADLVLLATSKARRGREVPMNARNRHVRIVLEETATAVADLLAEQCAILEEVRRTIQSPDEIPFDIRMLGGLIEDSDDVVPSNAVRQLIETEIRAEP